MSRRHSLTVRDFERCLALINNVTEIPLNHTERRCSALTQGVRELLNCDFSVAMALVRNDAHGQHATYRGAGSQTTAEDPDAWTVGFWRATSLSSERDRFIAQQYFNRRQYASDPFNAPFVDRVKLNRTTLCTRRDLIDDDAWYRHPHVSQYRKMIGADDILAMGFDVQPGVIISIDGNRAWRRTPFTERDRQLISVIGPSLCSILWQTLRYAPLCALRETRAWLCVRDGRTQTIHVSPREQAVIAALLQGSSEKEIASELEISLATAHQYITSVFRKFDVRGRAEFMANFIPHSTLFPPVPVMERLP